MRCGMVLGDLRVSDCVLALICEPENLSGMVTYVAYTSRLTSIEV